MNAKLIGRTAFLSLVGLLLASSVEAGRHPKVDFGGEFIQKYGRDCTLEGGLAFLKYNRDIIENFASRMRKYGNKQKFVFGNTSAESTDLAPSWFVRNGHAGKDYLYGDNVEVYAISTHGGRNHSTNNFGLCMCSSPAWSREARINWMQADSHSVRWGDQKMRWALLFSCHSAENPHLEWMDALGPHFEVLMGFDGLVYAGYTTDENLEDWVDNVYDDQEVFKTAWFEANEDWYYSDIRSVMMAVGDSLNEAIFRRNNQTIYSSRRNGGAVPAAFAWSSRRKGTKEVRYTYTR